MTEQQLHAAVAEYLDTILAPGSWYTTIPLGGGGAIRGANLKRIGTKAGTPDILVLYNSRCFFIELKCEKGKVSGKQEDCHEDILEAGGSIAVCRSIENVRNALKGWAIPTREARG